MMDRSGCGCGCLGPIFPFLSILLLPFFILFGMSEQRGITAPPSSPPVPSHSAPGESPLTPDDMVSMGPEKFIEWTVSLHPNSPEEAKTRAMAQYLNATIMRNDREAADVPREEARIGRLRALLSAFARMAPDSLGLTESRRFYGALALEQVLWHAISGLKGERFGLDATEADMVHLSQAVHAAVRNWPPAKVREGAYLFAEIRKLVRSWPIQVRYIVLSHVRQVAQADRR